MKVCVCVCVGGGGGGGGGGGDSKPNLDQLHIRFFSLAYFTYIHTVRTPVREHNL